MDILALLGTFFTAGPWSLALGAVLFFGVGLIGAALYAGLWHVGVGSPSLRSGLILGALHGVASVVLLQILYALHPVPPPLYMTGEKSLIVLLGHLAYGAVVAAVCRGRMPGTACSGGLRASGGGQGR